MTGASAEHKGAVRRLAQELGSADQHDLMAGVAGLSLMPENVAQMAELQTAAQLAASLPPRAGQPLSAYRWRRWLTQPPLYQPHFPGESRAGVQGESPSFAREGDVFCEEVSFYGGSRRVCSAWPQSVSAFRTLAAAAWLMPGEFPDRAYRRRAELICSAVLSLADAITRRAGLERHQPGLERRGQPIAVPSTARLIQLQRAVTFSPREVATLCQPAPSQVLTALTIEHGQCELPGDPTRSPLLVQPLVHQRDQLVVGSPRTLVAALVHHLVLLAEHHGAREELARRYAASALAYSLTDLERLGCVRVSVELPPTELAVEEAVVAFDTDKLLHLLVLPDDLSGRHPGQLYAPWVTDQLSNPVAERLGEVRQYLYARGDAPNEVLSLMVLAGACRVGGLELPAPTDRGALQMALEAHELEAFARAERGHALGLWRFARELDRLHTTTEVFATSALDLAHAWRSNQSFYFTDDKAPGVLILEPGEGGALRREALELTDPHGAAGMLPGTLVELDRATQNPSEPLYVPATGVGAPAIVVEALPVPVWVVSPGGPAPHELWSQYAEMLSYWIWQLAPALEPYSSGLDQRIDALRIELEIEGGEEWLRQRPAQGPLGETEARGTDTLVLQLFPATGAAMNVADNRGERELLRIVLRGLAGLLDWRDLGEAEIARALDQQAPLGLKKKITRLPAEHDPALGRGELPSAREVVEAEADPLRDQLAHHLANRGFREGRREGEARLELLNEAVDWHARRLAELLASFSPDGLLEQLVIYNEALVYRQAVEELTLETRRACYSDIPESVKRLSQRLPHLAQSAVACRLLIEHVTVRRPQGLRPLSAAAFDLALAHASELVGRATLSDLLRAGLSDSAVSILPSGRLGQSSDRYQEGRERFLSVYAGEVVAAGAESYTRRFEPTGLVDAEHIEQLNHATRAEFGFSMEEMVHFLVAVQNIGYELPGEAKVMERGLLLERAAVELEWPVEHAAQALDLFELRPRADFWSADPPFRHEDTYPWRFNRALSYVRRPLLLREEDGREKLLWGNRHVHVAGRNLVGLLEQGRLKAQSRELSQLQCSYRDEEALKFNDRVAELYRGRPELLVGVRVEKFGRLYMRRANNEKIGDIDVLVADPRRRRLLAVDTKHLVPGRAPHELRNEFESTFAVGGRKRSGVDHQLERVEWLELHLTEVLATLGLGGEKSGRWRVEGLLIMSEPLLAPFVSKVPLPVTHYSALEERLAAGELY